MKQAKPITSARSTSPGRLFAGDIRYVHFRPRQRPGQPAAGPSQHQDRAQLRLHQRQGAVRRHRHRASGVGRRICRRGVPTPLATIVQLDPIYVNFNVSEQDVLRVRADAKRRGITIQRFTQLPVEVGLQTENGYPHKGKLDYVAPTINQSTGTLAVRGVLPIPTASCCPAITSASASPSTSSRTRCWCLISPSAATRPGAMCWWSTGTTSSSSARSRSGRSRASARHRKRPETRRSRRHRRAAARCARPEGRSAAAEERSAASTAK